MTNPIKLFWDRVMDTITPESKIPLEIENYTLKARDSTTFDEIMKLVKKLKYIIEQEKPEENFVCLNEIVRDAVYRVFIDYNSERSSIAVKVIYPDEFEHNKLDTLAVTLGDINQHIPFGSFKVYAAGIVSFNYEYLLDRGHFNSHILEYHIKHGLDLCEEWYTHIIDCIDN